MDPGAPKPVILSVGSELRVSALIERPPNARALFVMAHGAGAGMHHAFLSNLSRTLTALGIACLRYQFPYMERGGRRPDPPAACHATVRAAVMWAAEHEPHLPLLAGGKSFGGRMTSQAQAVDPLPGVRGLVFLGFPLHPAKKPSLTRADHLSKIQVPLVFVQGTRDDLADSKLMLVALGRLGDAATLVPIEGADHAFRTLARSGRTEAAVIREIAEALEAWIGSVLPDGPRRV